MYPSNRFIGRSQSFWAYTKLISEKLGYSQKGDVLYFDENEIVKKFKEMHINIEQDMLYDVINYLKFRSDLLNNHIKNYFMNSSEAKEHFNELCKNYDDNHCSCKLPLNKQKHEKSGNAYFTCIINIITEITLRNFSKKNNMKYGHDIYFDDDPRNLTYFQDADGRLISILSRRFDGAYPSIVNPLAIWEIKEYYYTTTFGSRIADGVYETQLDGFEINSLPNRQNSNLKHIYFIDDYNTWWNMGKSYLCRIIDMLHIGLVDEVIFGREVFDRWANLLNEILYTQFLENK